MWLTTSELHWCTLPRPTRKASKKVYLSLNLNSKHKLTTSLQLNSHSLINLQVHANILKMSSLYNLEPQPTGSCILHTTSGDISLELFAQQTPLTSRNFLQHCLDGYYNGTIFHRLIPGFILQGGDPTGTGNGGSSIYDGGAFAESREENGIWPMEERRGANAGRRWRICISWICRFMKPARCGRNRWVRRTSV